MTSTFPVFLQFFLQVIRFIKIHESNTKRKTITRERRTDKEENPERAGGGKHTLTYLNLDVSRFCD